MTDSGTSSDPQDPLFDPREPGAARRIYTVVAVLVVVAMIVGLGSSALWNEIF